MISVTPRVLRAPAVTPRDEEMRPSGTLQSPTTGSLAEMIREADREDQIAAARALPRNVTLQLPDAPVRETRDETVAQNTTPANLPPPAGTWSAQIQLRIRSEQASPGSGCNDHELLTRRSANMPPANTTAANNKPAAAAEELPSFVPAPKSLISDQAAANVATVNPGTAGTQNAVLTSLPKAS